MLCMLLAGVLAHDITACWGTVYAAFVGLQVQQRLAIACMDATLVCQ